jgi:GTP cyclohydrolase I
MSKISEAGKGLAENAVYSLLTLLEGEDEDREGLKDTPKRYVKFLEQFLTHEEFKFTTFKNEEHDEMIIVKNIQFYSLCEHHLAPFFGTASIAYIPNADIICGISKIPRVLDKFARRFQNQERIGTQVADFLMKELKPKGVAVIITARHMCMEMRGIKACGAETTTSTMKGVFKTEMNCRQEFLNLIK